jgi:hypothetical protein
MWPKVEVEIAEFNYKLASKSIATKVNLFMWLKLPLPNSIHCNTPSQIDKHLLYGNHLQKCFM